MIPKGLFSEFKKTYRGSISIDILDDGASKAKKAKLLYNLKCKKN